MDRSSAPTLDWTDMLEALTALRHGDFAPRLPPQPAGTPEAAVVEAYHDLVLHFNLMTAELTRVVRELGIDSRLGCQAEVAGLDGRWRELHDEVNQLAALHTVQIRLLGRTMNALAKGAAVAPVPQDARGEMRGVQVAVNQLVERLQGTRPSTSVEPWSSEQAPQHRVAVRRAGTGRFCEASAAERHLSLPVLFRFPPAAEGWPFALFINEPNMIYYN